MLKNYTPRVSGNNTGQTVYNRHPTNMRQYLILAFISTLSIASFGQRQSLYKAGGYSTLANFQNNTPNYLDTFIMSRRTTGDIKAWGGNDYMIKSMKETTTKKVIKNKIWGIFINDTLYLNGINLTGLDWYSKVELFGKYCFLKPAFPVSPKIQKELGVIDSQYGYTFGAIGGAIQGAKIAVKRIPLIYSILNGQKMLLSKKNIIMLLESHPEIKTNFLNEPKQESEETLLKYLKILNEK